MNIITLANEKGGVGKSTLAIHLAAGLAILGQRVILVDADAQASATSALGVAEQPGLYDVLIRDAIFGERLVRIAPEVYADRPAKGELLLLPSNVEARNIANMLAEVTAVLERFSELQGWADTVIFDTPPTPSLFHSAIYTATDYAIYPCVCEQLAIDGLAKSMARLKPIAALRQANGKPPTCVLGIVPTMYRSQTALHTFNLKKLRELYGDLVRHEIPQRIAWSEVSQMRQTVFAYEKNGAAADAWKFVNETQEVLRAQS